MSNVAFRSPTVGRYRALFFQHGRSVSRLLRDERMMRCGLSGRVLDFGGGANAQYANEVQRWAAPGQVIDYWSANIDPTLRPTHLVRVGEPLAIDSGSFDAVVSLSTLEHVYELNETLAELGRVLKPEGRLVLFVPFMFRVHGHPDDYHRGTASFWRRKLAETGFGKVTVEALAWGPFSTAHMAGGLVGPFKSVRRHGALLLDILWCSYRYRGKTEVIGQQDDAILSAPLGYFIEARTASRAPRSSVGRETVTDGHTTQDEERPT